MCSFEQTKLFAQDETVGETQMFGDHKLHVPLVTQQPIESFCR